MAKKNLKRLMDLLGENDLPSPTNLKEAAFVTEAIPERVPMSAIRKENGCGKACYGSQPAVRKAIKARLRKGTNVPKLREYFCKECMAWHMASMRSHGQPKRLKKDRGKRWTDPLFE